MFLPSLCALHSDSLLFSLSLWSSHHAPLPTKNQTESFFPFIDHILVTTSLSLSNIYSDTVDIKQSLKPFFRSIRQSWQWYTFVFYVSPDIWRWDVFQVGWSEASGVCIVSVAVFQFYYFWMYEWNFVSEEIISSTLLCKNYERTCEEVQL